MRLREEVVAAVVEGDGDPARVALREAGPVPGVELAVAAVDLAGPGVGAVGGAVDDAVRVADRGVDRVEAVAAGGLAGDPVEARGEVLGESVEGVRGVGLAECFGGERGGAGEGDGEGLPGFGGGDAVGQVGVGGSERVLGVLVGEGCPVGGFAGELVGEAGGEAGDEPVGAETNGDGLGAGAVGVVAGVLDRDGPLLGGAGDGLVVDGGEVASRERGAVPADGAVGWSPAVAEERVVPGHASKSTE